MELKIGKNTYNITNKDWILDNGSIYQCMTLTYKVYDSKVHSSKNQIQVMSKKMFKDLVKAGQLVEFTTNNLNNKYKGCKFWRFNF